MSQTSTKPTANRFNDITVTWALCAVLAAMSAAVSFVWGPFPVWVLGQKTAYLAGPTYMVPLAIPFGILLAEALIDFRRFQWTGLGLVSAGMILSMIILSGLKCILCLQVSGHSMELGFFLLHELVENRKGRNWKLMLASVALLHTAFFKLYLWSDPYSMLIGLGFGLLLFGIERFLRRWSRDPRVWFPALQS